jgi:hypothetical protein
VVGSEPEEVKEYTIINKTQSKYVYEEEQSAGHDDNITMHPENGTFMIKKGSY